MSHLLPLDNISSFSSSNYGGVDTDWLEDEDFHIFKINIPGLKREDVKLQVVGGDTLQVSGVRKGGSERAYGKWHMKERPVGTFLRKFQLPAEVKADEITAFDEYGVLTITVPKKKLFIRNIPISML
ncbi:hypothetical protein GOP47_0019655 [Adiantum capillus-veneris]|uniref:SHSP domain-containing protein n=1 Tax=Adiantum capillus-veneris TaxID=13818 RepID=A0A9D4Z8P1_ADICA|nr:hypothetical protein GOP47_0019655 [Adiantum capillus-veneris]